MPVISLREQRKGFLGGVEQTGLWQGGAKVWVKPAPAPAASWSFLNNIAGLSGYTINSRTADTIVFSRATTARSHLIFEWGMPTGTRLRFRYVKTGPALLWARTCDDTAGVNMAREIFGGSNSTSVDIVLNTRPYMGFLTASAQPADLTTYTIDQLIVDLP